MARRYRDATTGKHVVHDGPLADDPFLADDYVQNRSTGLQVTRLRVAREEAINRTWSHFITLLQQDFPDIQTMEEARLVLGTIVRGVLVSARTPELVIAIGRYQHARTTAQTLGSANRATAEAYQPDQDPNWP